MAGFAAALVETTFWGENGWTAMQDALVNQITLVLCITHNGS